MRSCCIFVSLLLPLLLPVLAAAQVQPYTKAIPSFATGYYDGVDGLTTSITGGRTKLIFQMWYRGDTVPSKPAVMVALGERPMQTATAPAAAADLEVVLSSTSATASTLSTTFASNLGNDATVFFKRKVYNMPASSNHADPDQPIAWLPGDQPFVWIQGPHFLVQTVVQTAATAGNTGHRAQALAMRLGTSGHATSEPSCGGMLTATYSGASYSLALSGAKPNAPALFMLALRNATLGGVVPLPMDLGPLGMSGCVLAVDPLINVPLTADGAGNVQLSAPFPLLAEAIFLHAQVVHGSNANAVGLATSNVAHSVIGSGNLMAYVYNFNDVTPVATSGPFTSVRGPVFLYR